MKKYKFKCTKVEWVNDHNKFAYSVYKRFLLFFWLKIATFVSEHSTKAKDQCRSYILKLEQQ